MLKTSLCAALALLIAQPLFGYVLEGFSWTKNRSVQMQLSLGGPHPLIDGSASFNASAADALAKWNAHLAHMQFVPVLDSAVTPSNSDDQMSAGFSSTVFGDDFGSGTLAVTVTSARGGITDESDTLFNTAYAWDSYTGPLRPGLEDFHRVALHEFGHTVGLDHPDEHGQTVTAIMNSHVSDIYALQADDIAGAKDLYGDGPAELTANDGPILANISTRAFVEGGDKAVIGGFIVQGTEPATVILRAIGTSLDVQGVSKVLPDTTITVYDAAGRELATNDDWISGDDPETIASYHLDPPASIESALLMTLQPGQYTAVVSSFSNAQQPAETGTALFELYDLHTTGGRAGNLSTRGQVLPGDGALIGGFIIGGAETKPVVVRAIGPSISGSVPGFLSDPTLELHDGNGDLLASNDDWAQGPDADTIEAEGLAPTKPKESALQATLGPGNYTAVVQGANGATGIGLVEVYDLSPAP